MMLIRIYILCICLIVLEQRLSERLLWMPLWPPNRHTDAIFPWSSFPIPEKWHETALLGELTRLLYHILVYSTLGHNNNTSLPAFSTKGALDINGIQMVQNAKHTETYSSNKTSA